ncbi:MAG: hypothetical protein M9938_09320 [Solirubrobacterales bacterium]|nr:hypothetical protein [Solirubrobacterales bacterium]
MPTDTRPISSTTAARVDQMILLAVLDLNRPPGPRATPDLIAGLLLSGRYGPGPSLNVPLPEPGSCAFLNPDLVHARISRLITNRFLGIDRSGKVFLPEIPGRLL